MSFKTSGTLLAAIAYSTRHHTAGANRLATVHACQSGLWMVALLLQDCFLIRPDLFLPSFHRRRHRSLSGGM